MQRWDCDDGTWVEELNAEETQREVQPLIDRIFDDSKLKYTVGFTELGCGLNCSSI